MYILFKRFSCSYGTATGGTGGDVGKRGLLRHFQDVYDSVNYRLGPGLIPSHLSVVSSSPDNVTVHPDINSMSI